MKKLSLIFLVIIALLSSCEEKQEMQFDNNGSTRNRATLISGDSKDRSYSFSFRVGHDASYCNNACVVQDGKTVHVPCQGDGDQCLVQTNVSVSPSYYNRYTAITLDSTALTSDSSFNMPNRSLFVGSGVYDKNTWINIPAQVVYRDATTHQFTFTNLFYSDGQYYKNE